jgi:hypothetical protein
VQREKNKEGISSSPLNQDEELRREDSSKSTRRVRLHTTLGDRIDLFSAALVVEIINHSNDAENISIVAVPFTQS